MSAAYKFRVMDRSGKTKEGELMAASPEEAESRLSSQGDTVISIIPLLNQRDGSRESVKSKIDFSKIKVGKKKPKTADVATVLRNLAVMCESGVPFYESLQAAATGVESAELKADIDKVAAEVLKGRTLGQALKAAPDTFSGIICDIVSVGEESGKLDRALAAAANYLERSVALKAKLVNALIYPAILLAVAGLTVFALVFFIMPRFAETFQGMNIKPPMTTQLLMDFGTAATSKPLLFLFGIAAIGAGVYFAIKNPQVNRQIVWLSRRIPILGKVLRQLSVARMLQTLSSLMAGGVPLLTALMHSGRVAGDPEVLAATERALADVEKGGMLSDSFKASGVLPPTIVQMMAVGEKTGQMARLISRASEEMESQADARLKSLMSIFEPMMILVMGGVIGLITFSLISPLFSVLQNVK